METCLFLGSKAMGLRCIEIMMRVAPGAVCAAATIDDRDDRRSACQSFLNMKQKGLPVHIVEGTRQDIEALLNQYHPAMVFVCGWYRIIPSDLPAVPPRGFAGFHFSLLPRYRGGAPVVRAMINGEKESGYSLFQLDGGMDTGPLYAQGRVAIEASDYIGDLLQKIEDRAAACLEDCFADILSGRRPPLAQPPETAAYGGQRLPSDGAVDRRRPSLHIYNFIRAQSRPYPGAFRRIGTRTLHIWKAVPNGRVFYGIPGQVLCFANEEAIVACGSGTALRIQQADLDGVPCSPRSALRTIKARLLSERGASDVTGGARGFFRAA